MNTLTPTEEGNYHPNRMPLLKFTGYQATSHKAIAVSFDLGGFSDFCKQPDTTAVDAPRLIKNMFDSLNATFSEQGEVPSHRRLKLQPQRRTLRLRRPILPPLPSSQPSRPTTSAFEEKLPPLNFNKFTGDGALMLWTRTVKEDFSQEFCDNVVRSMRRFQIELSSRLPKWEEQWRRHGLPKRVRVGIATGIIYGLRRPHNKLDPPDPIDYVGYCLNLAVRLQDHYPELGFLVHADLHPGLQGMSRYEAIKLKGCASEPVALFIEDKERAEKESEMAWLHFQSKFKSLDPT